MKELAPSLRGGAVREERFKHLRLVVSAGEARHPETLHWTAVHEAGDRIGATALRARAAEVDPDATAFFMSGAVVTEQIFVVPGFGRLIVEAVFTRDYPLVQGVVLITASSYVLINLLVDLSYSLVNPRIRIGAARGA